MSTADERIASLEAENAALRADNAELVAQIEFGEWTPDGHLRHSRFAGLREDKDPCEVVREIVN